MFFSNKAQRDIKKRDGMAHALMLATIRDGAWNVLNMQHIILNSKKIPLESLAPRNEPRP